MRRLLAGISACGLALAALLVGAPGAAAASTREANAAASVPVRILIQSPKPGEALRNKVHQAPIRGSAAADGERPADFDVMIVVFFLCRLCISVKNCPTCAGSTST